MTRGPMGHTDRERVLRRLGEPDRLGCVLGSLGESAELVEARDQNEVIEEGDRCAVAEGLMYPIGRLRREAVGGKLDRLRVLAPKGIDRREKARAQDAEIEVP